MSTGGPQTPDTALLAQQVDAVVREQAALSAAASRGRSVRLLMYLGLLAVLAVTIFWMYRLGDKILNSDPYHQEVIQAVQEHIAQNQQIYMNELRQLMDAAAPVVTDAFTQQAKKDIPVYIDYLDKQRDEMIKELGKQLTDRVDKQYAGLMERQQDTLRKEFPESENPDFHKRVQDNLEKALNKVARRYFLEDMQKQTQAMLGLWDNFPTAPPPSKSEQSLEDQFSATLINLLMYRISHPNTWTLNPDMTP